MDWNLHMFGSKVFVLDKNPVKGKFEARAREGIFVGYPRTTKGYRVWYPSEHKVIEVRDVKFQEDLTTRELKDDIVVDEIQRREEKEPKILELQFHSSAVSNEGPPTGAGDCVGECMPLGENEPSNTGENLGGGDSSCNERGTTEVKPSRRILRRAPGRPKLVKGERGRPKKVYRMIEEEEIEKSFSQKSDEEDPDDEAGANK